MWAVQREAFAPSRRVLIPDLPGHGRSSREPYPGGPETTDLLAALLSERRIRDVDVVGFSLGAQHAVDLAARHPELVRSAVVISALSRRSAARAGAGLVGLTARLAHPLTRSDRFNRLQARSLFIPEPFLPDYLRDARRMSSQSLAAVLRTNFAFQIPQGWGRPEIPALLLAGAREPRSLLSGMRDLHAAAPGSTLEVWDGFGHGIPLQAPDRLNARLRSWFA
jgi:pimeloyl-ACP methyl ester carboxylesterase